MFKKIRNKILGRKSVEEIISLDNIIARLPDSTEKYLSVDIPFHNTGKLMGNTDMNKEDLKLYLKSHYRHCWDNISVQHEETICKYETEHYFKIDSYTEELTLPDGTKIEDYLALRTNFSYVIDNNGVRVHQNDR